MKRTRKPKKWSVGPIRVRAVRGPKFDRWYWRAEVHRDGQSDTVWTGWASRKEAEVHLGGLLAQGLSPTTTTATSNSTITTVQDLMEVYVGATEDRRDLSPNTKSISRTSGRHIVRHLGDVMLSRLGMREMELLRDARLQEGAATQTTQHDIDILRRAWNWGRSRGFCPDKTLPKPRLVIQPTRQKYTPSRVEYWKVVDQLNGWPKLLVLLMGATGTRVGEASSLCWSHVDLETGEITIPSKKGITKTLYRKTVIPVPLLETLKAMEPGAPQQRLIPVSVDTARTSITQRYLKDACKAAKVPYFTPHGLRRMVIDQLYTSGVDVGTVAAMLGQSPQVALRHYRQARRSDKEKAARIAGLGERGESNVIEFDKRLTKDA